MKNRRRCTIRGRGRRLGSGPRPTRAEQVRQCRKEEMNYMVKTLGMFDFGSWEEATSKAGKIDRV